MFCKYCGQAVEESAVFCSNCGANLKEAPSENSAAAHESAPVVEQKSRLVAGLLGVLLGYLGVHNFYLGYTNKAVAQLLICIVGACLVVGPMVAFIWGLVEGIQILTGSINKDANGVPLKE